MKPRSEEVKYLRQDRNNDCYIAISEDEDMMEVSVPARVILAAEVWTDLVPHVASMAAMFQLNKSQVYSNTNKCTISGSIIRLITHSFVAQRHPLAGSGFACTADCKSDTGH